MFAGCRGISFFYAGGVFTIIGVSETDTDIKDFLSALARDP